MAKVKMQWKAPKDSASKLTKEEQDAIKYKGAWDILRKAYHADGLKGWYIGMQAQIMKAVLSQAIVFTIKEKLTFYTTVMFAILSKNKQLG